MSGAALHRVGCVAHASGASHHRDTASVAANWMGTPYYLATPRTQVLWDPKRLTRRLDPDVRRVIVLRVLAPV
jgi:hypothetical protein